jgi:hypothetical protein
MNRAARMQQEQADSWLAQHGNWDDGIPDPESFARPLFLCSQTDDGREKYDTRHAVPEPGSWLPDLPNALALKKCKRRHKAVNIQLICGSSEQECFEAEAVNAAVAARIDRKRDFAMEQYNGKYREVLSLFLLGLPIKEIAARSGKTSRRIRQIINGNAPRRTIGLRKFAKNLCEPPPAPVDQSRPTGAGVAHGC